MGMMDVRRRVMMAGMFKEETATGNPMQFQTNLAKPLKSLVLPFSPFQLGSGDPSPNNRREIVGWTGANAWRSNGYVGVYGFAAQNVNDTNPSLFPSTNAYGTTLSATQRQYPSDRLVITQTAHSASLPTSYQNGYICIVIDDDGLAGKDINISMDVDVTSDPIGVNKFQIMPNGMTGAEISIVNGKINGQITYAKNNTQTARSLLEVRICGISCVISNISITLANADTQTASCVFPAVGKNLCPDKVYQSSNLSVYIGQDNATDFPIKLIGGVTYTLSFVASANVNGIYLREESEPSGTVISNQFTPTQTGNYRIALTSSGGISTGDLSNVMLNEGSTALPYEPYTNTVYGGYVDPVKGQLVVEWGALTKNSATMAGGSGEDYPGWQNSGIRALIGLGANGGLPIGTKIDKAKTGTAITSAYTDSVFLPKAYNGLTQSEWKALAVDVTFVVPLATPITIPLTPTQIQTLIGDNVIWTDTNGSNTAVYLKR